MLHCQVCRKEKPLICPACCMARTLEKRLAYLNLKLTTRQLSDTLSDLCTQKHVYRIKQAQNLTAHNTRRLQNIKELCIEAEESTASKRTDIQNLRDSIKHRREALQSAKVAQEDVSAWRIKLLKEMQEYKEEIPSLEAMTRKIGFRLACEAAVITCLRFRRVHWPARGASGSASPKAVETREIITIGGIRVPDMSEFTQFNRRMINAVLERVIFLLCLMTDYISVRLPHKLYLPNPANPRPGIFDSDLDERIDLMIGSSHDRKHGQMSKISRFGRGILIERSRKVPHKSDPTQGKSNRAENVTAGLSPIQYRSGVPSSEDSPRMQSTGNQAKRTELSSSPVHKKDRTAPSTSPKGKESQERTDHGRHGNDADKRLASRRHSKTRVLQPLPAEAAAAVMRAASSGSKGEYDGLDNPEIASGAIKSVPHSPLSKAEVTGTLRQYGSSNVSAPESSSSKHSSSEKNGRLIEGLALLAMDVARLSQIFGIEITRKNFLDIGLLLYMGVKKISTLGHNKDENIQFNNKDVKDNRKKQSENNDSNEDFPEDEWYDWAVSQLRTSIERDEWSMVEREDWT